MGKSLIGGCSKNSCCSSKSLFNFDINTADTLSGNRTLESFLDSLPPPDGTGGEGDNGGGDNGGDNGGGDNGGGGDLEIPDPLEVNNANVFNLLQTGDTNIFGTLSIGGGQITFMNNMITGLNDIIFKCDDVDNEVLVECNFRTTGGYTRLESNELRINDDVPVIGYINETGILQLDNNDRGLEFNYVTTVNNTDFVFNRGFMGYDKVRDRFVLWSRSTIDTGGSGLEQNYVRSGSDRNELDIDTIYTATIRNPDYPIGTVTPSNLDMEIDNELRINSILEQHRASNSTYDIAASEIHTIGLSTGTSTGRFMVITEDVNTIIPPFDGSKSRIELNNTTAGDGSGLYLYHPDKIDIQTCSLGSQICINSEGNLKLQGNSININSDTSISFNTGDKIIFDDPIDFNSEILAKNIDNEVNANCLTFIETIFPLTRKQITTTPSSITLPLGNAGVLYYDNSIDAIKGVRDTANTGDTLVFNGSDVVWATSNISLQDAYSAGDVTGDLGVITINDNIGRILIKDSAINSIDGILFQVTDSSGSLLPGTNIFSVNNDNTDDKSVKVNGNLSLEGTVTAIFDGTNTIKSLDGVICQTTGIEFKGTNTTVQIPIPPFLPITTITISVSASNPGEDITSVSTSSTVWYDNDEFRLKIGHNSINRPFALAPNNVGGSNRILKLSSSAPQSTHLLTDTGLSSNISGELTVPIRLIATSSDNKNASDRLIFSGVTQILSSPLPVGPGGVLYYNGSNIIGVTDIPSPGEVLGYNGSVVEWVPAGGVGSVTLQDVYNNSTPSVIEVNSTNGPLLIKDNNTSPTNDILFQVTDGSPGTGPGTNLFLIDKNPGDDKNVKINGSLSVNNMVCNTKGIEFEGTTGLIILVPEIIIEIPPLPPIIIPEVSAILPLSNNPASNVSAAAANRTLWYDLSQERLKMGDNGDNLPVALSPNNVGGSNRLVKIALSDSNETHILSDTGLSSPSLGALTVPNQIIATSAINKLASDRLIFDLDTKIITGPSPIGPGGVIYFNGSSIIGVTDIPLINEVLQYDGSSLVWGQSTSTLQNAYDNSTGSSAMMELNNTRGKLLVKDNSVISDSINNILFQVVDTSNSNLISVDPNPANGRNIKINGNTSISGVLSTVNGVEFFPLTSNPAITSTQRTMWYSGPENRVRVGHSTSDRPIALAPDSISGPNRLMKVSTTGNTHLLSDSGLISPAIGALSIPNALTAVNVNNNVAANNLLFNGTTITLNTPSPIGPGGVIYNNGSNIVGVTDIPNNGDILYFNGSDIEWRDIDSIKRHLAQYILFSSEIVISSTTFTSIAFFPWNSPRYGSANLNYNNGVLILYLESPGSAFNIDIQIIDSSLATIFLSSSGLSVSGVFTIPFTSLPTISGFIQLRSRITGVGTTNPIIRSALIEFDY